MGLSSKWSELVPFIPAINTRTLVVSQFQTAVGVRKPFGFH